MLATTAANSLHEAQPRKSARLCSNRIHFFPPSCFACCGYFSLQSPRKNKSTKQHAQKFESKLFSNFCWWRSCKIGALGPAPSRKECRSVATRAFTDRADPMPADDPSSPSLRGRRSWRKASRSSRILGLAIRRKVNAASAMARVSSRTACSRSLDVSSGPSASNTASHSWSTLYLDIAVLHNCSGESSSRPVSMTALL